LLGLDFLGGFVHGFLGERRLEAKSGQGGPAVTRHDPILQPGSMLGPRSRPDPVRPPQAPDDPVGLREPPGPKPGTLPGPPQHAVVEPPEPEKVPELKIIKPPIKVPTPSTPEKIPGLPLPQSARKRMLTAADKLYHQGMQTFQEGLDRNSREQIKRARRLMARALEAYRQVLRKHPGDREISERIRRTNAARYRMMKSTGV